MIQAVSLQDYYNSEQAFRDPDRMIRIAALHHAGRRLEGNPHLRRLLRDLLQDPDALVARYAALTLAQAEDGAGVKALLDQARAAEGPAREQLDACLRNCTRYPFAVLLNEAALIETVPRVTEGRVRDLLEDLQTVAADSFYERAGRDQDFRAEVVGVWDRLDECFGLECRPGAVSGGAVVLATPLGKQPGFLYAPERRLFLKFTEDAVLNRHYLQRGRDALFVARLQANRYEADVLYLLEDSAAGPVEAPPDLGGRPGEAGLLPGVVASRWGDRPNVQVVCPDGRSFVETYRTQKAFLGQLALVEPETALDKSQCHFLPGFRLGPEAVGRLVRAHAAAARGSLARVVEVHEDRRHPKTGHVECVVELEDRTKVTTFVPAPRPDDTVLMGPCPKCDGAGAVPCEPCGGKGNLRCDTAGSYGCRPCRGTGKFREKDCVVCAATGLVRGCGGNGEVNCPVCGGEEKLWCNRCDGRGSVQCRRCYGTGRYGGGECYPCGGIGYLTCRQCDGAGGWECFLCKGDRVIRCPACEGRRDHPCARCREQGQVRCPYCKGKRLTFQLKLDCLR